MVGSVIVQNFPGWMQMMARYNAWQNDWMVNGANGLPDAERRLDRGGFFGSIQGTLNHLLWGDVLWMSRFDGAEPPKGSIGSSAAFHANWQFYREHRSKTDARIIAWAEGLGAQDCAGEISWHSGAMKAQVTRDRITVFTHFFNHQTHHRGQVHGMLTAAGALTCDTDLCFMEQG